MALYSVYARTDAIPSVVPDRFSWLAALLPPVFMLAHRLWLPLCAFVLACGALVLGAYWLGDAAAIGLYVLGVVWLGFEAPLLRRLELARGGYVHCGDVVAMDPDVALSDWLKRTA